MLDNTPFSNGSVVTTYEAIDERYFSKSVGEPTTETPDEYLFHVSFPSEVKNLQKVVKSLDTLPPEVSLVVAGPGWKKKLAGLIEQFRLENRVVFLGYLEGEELIHWIDQATLLVFPSLYESFGLPNVESMARGTPVVTSNRGAIPEVVDDAARMVEDPHDSGELAGAITELLEKPDRRDQLSNRGRERAEMFRWSTHLSRVLDEYRKLV